MKKQKYIKIMSIKELREALSEDEFKDFVIQLAGGGLVSRKEMRLSKINGDRKYEVHNCAENDTQYLTRDQLEQSKYTNIGEAIRKGAFYQVVN